MKSHLVALNDVRSVKSTEYVSAQSTVVSLIRRPPRWIIEPLTSRALLTRGGIGSIPQATSVHLASHVVLSGHCKIGERCFIGVNATFRDFITIGDECFITMDASVSRDLLSGSVALGCPAKILISEDKRANIIKKKYFKF